MKYYEWGTDEENFTVKKNPETAADINQLISHFTREIQIRNIKLDSMAIAKWAPGGIV